MFLKHEYLAARFDDKPYFRSLFSQGEEMFAAEKPSAMPEISRALLLNLDLEALFAQKRRNIASTLEVLGRGKKFNFGIDGTGFGLTVLCDSSLERDRLREMLVGHNIFPAVLWPGQKTAEAQDFSSRVLFVHLDYRMSEIDARHIATLIKGFFT